MRYNPVSPPHGARQMGTRHMASSGHYLATQAAFTILQAGGNAIDAGVAGGLALSVVQCEYTHIGGVAPIMIYLADTDEVVTISGLGWWPRAASAEYFRKNHAGNIPAGIKRAVVPSAVDAWITALERHGTMSFAEVAAPAMRFAEEGFPVSQLMTDIIVERSEDFLNWPENTRLFMPGGVPPAPASVLRLPDLASTFRYMAAEESAARGGRLAGLEAVRGAFYRGDIAREIARFHAENDGWLTLQDLAEFRVGLEPPVKVQFDDIDVFTCGPWCQGPVLAQALQLMDLQELRGMRHNSVEHLHLVVEALKLAFADRHTYYGDPRFVDVPMDRLISADYVRERRKMIDPHKAWPKMPPAGTAKQLNLPATKVWAEQEIDTSYICVVDSAGNAFSATPSDGCLTGPMVPGTGINPSNRGSQSWTDPEHPACLAPGKRPRLTPSPAFARKRGEWIMPFGSPGNDIQPQAMMQVFLNIVAFDMPVGEAILQPRCGSYSYPASSVPHNYYPGRLSLEGRIPEETVEGLAKLGHITKEWQDWEWRAGSVCAIQANMKTGVLEGGADCRRPGGVAGL
jgi:gamma-glutamyltranspeptidase/glutathione hydrolase